MHKSQDLVEDDVGAVGGDWKGARGRGTVADRGVIGNAWGGVLRLVGAGGDRTGRGGRLEMDRADRVAAVESGGIGELGAADRTAEERQQGGHGVSPSISRRLLEAQI